MIELTPKQAGRAVQLLHQAKPGSIVLSQVTLPEGHCHMLAYKPLPSMGITLVHESPERAVAVLLDVMMTGQLLGPHHQDLAAHVWGSVGEVDDG